RAHQEQEPAPLRSHRDDIPAALEAVVRRMLAKDPARRYQTPAEVAAALAPFSGGDRERQTAALAVPTARGRSRPALPAGGLLGVAMLLAGLTWVLTRDWGRSETNEEAPVRVIGGEEWGPFNRAAISDDGRFALSANKDFSVGLWDLEAGKEVSRLPAHKSSVMGLAFSHDGKHALSSGRDQAVCLWDLNQRKLLLRRQEDADLVPAVG